MQETKDPAIKLFGKKIPLPVEDQNPAISGQDSISSHVAVDSQKGGGGDDGGQNKVQDHEPDKESEIGKVTEDEETEKSSENDDGAISEEKILKKPDQVLPCPRCKSMNTKFCYYNNYNINQPRHFCKSCQRYWTEGGTMRNVPVGAGRRKAKNNNSSSLYHYMTINESLRVAKISAPNETNGKVLNFGSYSSMGSVNVAENKIVPKSTQNGVPWPVPPLSSNYPAAFWSSDIPRFPKKLSSTTLPSPSCGGDFPILGKHMRDLDKVEREDEEREEQRKQRSGSVLVPKTLRIDDPIEAAESSIWTTLGIKKESRNGGTMFDGFKFNKDGKNQKQKMVQTCSVLRGNPAALSRSVYFHENT